jgi:hypothetical protein
MHPDRARQDRPTTTTDRYLAEFDFRYSNRIATGCDDTERAHRALQGVVGKRLTYKKPDRSVEA